MPDLRAEELSIVIFLSEYPAKLSLQRFKFGPRRRDHGCAKALRLDHHTWFGFDLIFELYSLNKIIHVDKVASDVGFRSVISIDQLLLLCREELSKNFDFIDCQSTLACLIQLWSL